MAFASIFNMGCGFFFWMIAARLYTIDQVGQAMALISALGLVILFSRLGLDFAIIRFFSSEDRGKVVSTSLIVTTAACILSGVIYVLLAEILAPSMILLRELGFALAFMLIGAMNSMTAIVGNASIAARKADHYFMQNFLMALRIPALLPLAFLGVFGIFVSVGVGYLIASCYGLMTLRRSIGTIRPLVDLEFIRRSFKFSAWNYASSILSAADMIIPIMMLNMLGEAEVARYYIAFAIGNIVMIIPGAFGTSIFVEGSHGQGLRRSVLRAGSTSFAVLVPAVLVLFLFGNRLLGLFGEEYVEAFSLLKIIALSSFLVSCYSWFIPIQNVRMKADSILRLSALRCMLLLVLSYVLVHMYGFLGVGYAWMATYGVIVLVIGWEARRAQWV